MFAFTGILLLTFSRPLEVFRAYISSLYSLGLLFAFCAYRSLFLVHATCMVFMFVFVSLLDLLVPSLDVHSYLIVVSLLLMCACDV